MSYDKNVDYGQLLRQAMEAGADRETVQSLLNQRVEKALSEQGLTQYVNDELYRQTLQYLTTAQSSQVDAYQTALERARAEAIAARENQTQQEVERLQGQENVIYEQSATDREKAYATARLSALAQEEKLAALGLGRGTGAAVSGYQETSRIAQDTTLQNAINQVNLSETDALRSLAAEIRQARQTGLADVAELEEKYQMLYAEYELKKQEQEQQQQEDLYQRQQDALNQYYDQLRQQQEQEQLAYQQAFQRWQLTGVVSQEDAPILGVPAGTKTADYEQQLFQQAQALSKLSSSGSSGSSRSSSSRSSSGNSSTSTLKTAKTIVEQDGATAAYQYLLTQGYTGEKLAEALEDLGLSQNVISRLLGRTLAGSKGTVQNNVIGSAIGRNQVVRTAQ